MDFPRLRRRGGFGYLDGGPKDGDCGAPNPQEDYTKREIIEACELALKTAK